MQDEELFDVTVSDALRLLTRSQKTNSTHHYCRIIRLCSGADMQGASGVESDGFSGWVLSVRGADRGRWSISGGAFNGWACSLFASV